MATYGIDLGTTYSCIARLDNNGNPIVIRNQIDGSDTLASAVFFESETNQIVGDAAKAMVETDGDRVVQFVKREIGKTDAKTREFFGKNFTPIEISALILKRLKEMLEEQGEEPIDNVVITCPAYFGLAERDATKKAGEINGFNVLNLINEPTAAALNYCARRFQEDKTILVYDLGGGTFDVTIIRMGMKDDGTQQVKILATGGNDLLGGKDWDDVLFNRMKEVCCEENGLDESDLEVNYPEAIQSLHSKVEDVKKALSQADQKRLRVTVAGQVTNITITREEFENLTQDLVAKTMSYVESVLNQAGNVDVDTVLLVGGSTYMPMIRNAVEARFPGKVQIEDPDRAVAKGAAIYASMMVEESVESQPSPQPGHNPEPGQVTVAPQIFDVVDQTPRSFGPGVLDENNNYIIDNIVKKGVEMPATVYKTYYTPSANMSSINLRVYESQAVTDTIKPCLNAKGEYQETDPSEETKYLGVLELILGPNTPQGSEIAVSFTVDGAGITIEATDVNSGQHNEGRINFVTGMSQDEIEESKQTFKGYKVVGE